MGHLAHESFEQFIESLKNAGVIIHNEQELKERLAEACHWQFAFATLAANGKSLGISFEGGAQNAEAIFNTFNDFHFQEPLKAAFSQSLNLH